MAIDIMAAFTQDPPQLDFVLPGFVAGTVGALVAPGATGKSFWALEAAMAIACSVAGGDILKLNPQHTGRVVYFAGEDPAPALIQRLHAIGTFLPSEARQAIAANFVLEPVMGQALNIMDGQRLTGIIKYTSGARLIVFDTLSRIHTLDENSNSDMARLINVMELIAAKTGAAVLFLHHVSKASAREGQADQQQAARGASALTDNARWCSYVARMSEAEAKILTDNPLKRNPIGDRRSYYVRFGVSKQNYDVTPCEQWYVRREGGVLLPVSLTNINSLKSESLSKSFRKFGKDINEEIDDEW